MQWRFCDKYSRFGRRLIFCIFILVIDQMECAARVDSRKKNKKHSIFGIGNVIRVRVFDFGLCEFDHQPHKYLLVIITKVRMGGGKKIKRKKNSNKKLKMASNKHKKKT